MSVIDMAEFRRRKAGPPKWTLQAMHETADAADFVHCVANPSNGRNAVCVLHSKRPGAEGWSLTPPQARAMAAELVAMAKEAEEA